MPKKTIIKLNSQTSSQDTFILDPHQNATNVIEEMFTKDDFLAAFDKVTLTDTTEEKSATEKKKTSG